MPIPFLHNILIKDENHIQFTTSAGANAGKIDQSGNDLVLSNAVGDIIIGNGSDDVFIGDGTNTVDIRFEQNMAIFADSSSTKTLTLGGANTSVVIESPTINGSLSLGATTMSDNLIFTTTNGHIVFDYETSDTGEYSSEVALLKIDRGGTEKTILSRVSKEGAIALGADDTVAIVAGDTKSVIKDNINYASENVVFASEGGFLAFGFPGNDPTWSNRNVFQFKSDSTTAGDNGLYIGDGGQTQFIDLSRNLKNIASIRGSGNMPFLTDGGSALKIRARSAYFGGTYANDGSNDGEVDAESGFRVGGTSVIDSSRNLANIGTISNTGDVTITNGNVIFSSQYGVRFNDANTRIYTNTDSPEDLIIEADQDLLLNPDGQVSITGNLSLTGDISTPGQINLPGDGTTSSFETLIYAHGSRGKLLKQGNAVFWQPAHGSNQFEITDCANDNSAKGNVLLRASGHNDDDNKLMLVPDGGKVGINETSIDAKLHISDSTTPNIKFERPGTKKWAMGISGTDFIIDDVNDDLSTHVLKLAADNSATFAGNITASGKVVTTEVESSGAMLLDAASDITIDAGGQDIILSDDGTIFGTLSNSSGFQIRSRVNNADMFFRGVDDGTEFNALQLDMSAGGNATFAGSVTATSFSGDGSNLTGVTSTDSTKLPLAGGTMTGALNLNYSGGGGQVGIDIHNTGTNTADDAKITFETQGQYDYIIGIDRSASEFKISRSSAFGTNDVISLDGSSNATFAGEVYTTGKLGIGTTDPNTDGYSFAEDLVIKGGNSANDGVGITLLANGKQYGVIAFADSDDASIGEIFYDHNGNRMYFRAGGNNNTLYVDNTAIVVDGNIGVSGTVDGRDIATDGAKLDGIASGATANTGTVTGVSATAPVLSSGGTTPTISVDTADVSSGSSKLATGAQIQHAINTASVNRVFSDNVKARFGNGNDLNIYHDGSNSYIENTGTGDLIFKGNTNIKVNGDGTGTVLFQVDASGDIGLQVDTGSGNYIFGDYGGVADGNYVNVSAGGAFSFRNGSSASDIKFQIDAASDFTRHKDSVEARFGNSDDLKIYHNGTDSYIDDSGTGDLRIRSNFLKIEKYTGETMATFNDDNAVTLYYNNSAKLATTSTGVSITGVVANRDIPMVIHASFDDTTSSTSNLIIPLAGSITETTVSGASAPHFFTIPYACVLKKVIMKTVSGSMSSSFTTELKAYKNGAVTGNSSSGELTHVSSSVSWTPTANNDITYAAGDKFSLVYQKSSTSKYWQDVAATIVFTLTDYDI